MNDYSITGTADVKDEGRPTLEVRVFHNGMVILGLSGPGFSQNVHTDEEHAIEYAQAIVNAVNDARLARVEKATLDAVPA